jgi:hypothetical protein
MGLAGHEKHKKCKSNPEGGIDQGGHGILDTDYTDGHGFRGRESPARFHTKVAKDAEHWSEFFADFESLV